MGSLPPLASLAGLLVGLSLLLALVGGTATLAGCLLAHRLRGRQAHRHPPAGRCP